MLSKVFKGRISSAVSHEVERRTPIGAQEMEIARSLATSYRTPITPEAALRLYELSVAINASVSMISSAAASLPFEIYKVDARGNRNRVLDSAVTELLEYVNPHMSEVQFRSFVFKSLILAGKAFVFFDEDDESPVGVSMYPFPPNMVEIEMGASGIQGFILKIGEQRLRFEKESVLYFYVPSVFDVFSGSSPIAPLNLATKLESSVFSAQVDLYENPARPEAVITVDARLGTMSQEQIDQFRQQWREFLAVRGRKHRVAVLWSGMDYKPIPLDAQSAQFINARASSKKDIYSIFRIPLLLVGETEAGDYESAEASFWRNAVIPWLSFYEGTINKFLLRPAMRKKKLVGAFNIRNIPSLRRDELNLVRSRVALVNSGIVTINEIRNELGLAPVLWGDMPPPSFFRGVEQSPSLPLPGTEGGRQRDTSEGPALLDESGEK